MGKQQYDPEWPFYWPLRRELDRSENMPGTPDPYANKNYETHAEMREKDIYPTGNSLQDFLRRQKEYATFLVIYFIAFCSCLCFYMACCKKKKAPTKRVTDREYTGVTDQSGDGTMKESLAIN